MGYLEQFFKKKKSKHLCTFVHSDMNTTYCLNVSYYNVTNHFFPPPNHISQADRIMVYLDSSKILQRKIILSNSRTFSEKPILTDYGRFVVVNITDMLARTSYTAMWNVDVWSSNKKSISIIKTPTRLHFSR